MECALWALGILIFLCILILVYGTVLEKAPGEREDIDVLNTEIFTVGGKSYSIWPISHFILYFILGYHCPCYWKEFTLIGVGWEVFESIKGDDKDKHHVVNTTNGKQYANWWAGSLSDIVANSLGLATGIIAGNSIRKDAPLSTECPSCNNAKIE